jgi:phosphoglycolate phosphatase
MAKPKAIIFDLDGTLLDTLDDLGNSVNKVLANHQFPTHEIEAYRYFIGDGAKRLIHRALPEDQRDEKLVQECLQNFKMDYEKNWHNQTSIYPGVVDLLDDLSTRKISLAILSNKPHDFTVKCVQHFLSKWSFKIVLGQHPSRPQKPDPAGALRIAEHIKSDPASFCYAGDSGVDMKTARAAGMYAIGVLWGYRAAEELRNAGAAVLVNKPFQISKYC